jgi:RNA polymerase sigma-70 factor (ECF subfamily)
VYEALDRLPPAKRAVLVMHDLEGLSFSEIALAVGANERTLRSRLRDGRRKLAEQLRNDPLFASGEDVP